MDEPISKSLEILKNELTLLVDTQVTNQRSVDTSSLDEPIEPSSTPPLESKATEDIVDFLTEEDPKEKYPSRDISNFENSKYINTLPSANVSGAYSCHLYTSDAPEASH